MAVPPLPPVARPLVSTLTTDVFVVVQMTCVVILWLVPSEYAPVAVNCRVSPEVRFELAGVTDTEDRVAEVTVKVVFAETPA